MKWSVSRVRRARKAFKRLNFSINKRPFRDICSQKELINRMCSRNKTCSMTVKGISTNGYRKKK